MHAEANATDCSVASPHLLFWSSIFGANSLLSMGMVKECNRISFYFQVAERGHAPS